MRKFILFAAYLALTGAATLVLSGCQQNPNNRYTIYYQGVPTDFASPYDDPNMYRGGGDEM
jgi:hypothetical protein